jgi:hypothetical protein
MNTPINTVAVILLLIFFILLLLNFIPILLFMFSVIPGAPFVPSSNEATRKILELVKKSMSVRIAELGSGNGKIVIQLAKAGFVVDGYEINPFLVLWSNWQIQRLGLGNNAHIHWQNIWTIDLGLFDTVIIYGIPGIMTRLRDKLETEVRTPTVVISNHFSFPGWESRQVGKYGSVIEYKLSRRDN